MERIIRPYGLIFEEGRWFLIAYCEFNKEIASFRIDRIEDAYILDEKFEIPGEFNVQNYNCRINYLTDYLKTSSQNVKLKLSKSLYYSIKDYAFLKYAEAIEGTDCFILNVKTTSPDRYVYHAFEFFNGMEILEPDYLREDFKKRLEKLYNKYKGY
jgi:predicted DNA-binding transcriptional regulator YafY